MFQEYRELFAELMDYRENELPTHKANLRLAEEQLEALDKEIETLERESLGENSPHLKAVIAKEAEKIEQDYRARLAVLAEKKRQITTDETRNRALLLENLDIDRGCESTLRLIYEIIQEYQEKFDTSNVSGLRVPIENYKALQKRAVILERHYDKYNQENAPFCKRIAEKVAMKDVFQSISNPKVAVGCMTGYILISTISALYLPVVAIAGYVGMAGLSVRDALKIRESKNSLERELWLLEKSYENIEATYREELHRKVQEANDKADADYANALAESNQEEETLKEEYQNLLKELKIMEKDPNFIARNLSIYQHKVNALRDNRTEYLEEIESAKEDLKDCEESIQDIINRLQSLREQIEVEYGGPLTPGSNRLMVNELFMGFERSGALRTFKFNADTTFVFYSGETSDATSIVMTIFLELLRTVNIAQLSFYIMDTNMGAPDFMPFTKDELSEVVSINTTREQCAATITKLHHAMEERNRSIRAYASDIHSFNKLMIEANSLTQEYIVLLIQECNGAILGQPQFEQICKAGPSVGIIPIVFLSEKWCNEQASGNGDKAEEAYKLLSTSDNAWFRYRTETEELGELSTRQIENLKKGLVNAMTKK